MEDAKSLRLRSVEFCYRELGFSFTPLRGKRPLLDAWQSKDRESLSQALAWAKAGNVGLRCGVISGGIVIVDLDSAKPCYRVDAVKALSLPTTVTARTGSGGYHLYLRLPDGVVLPNRGDSVRGGYRYNRLAPAVDIKCDGGQVVFPGSIHPDTGATYHWLDDRAPWQIEVAMMPDAIIARILGEEQGVWNIDGSDLSADAPPRGRDGDGLPGAPADTSVRPAGPAPSQSDAYARKALADEIATLSASVEGGRGEQLNRSAYSLGQLVGGGVLDRGQVAAGLLAACYANGLVGKDGVSDVKYHIEHSLSAGERQPRRPTPMSPVRHAYASSPDTPSAPGSAAPPPPLPPASDGSQLGERRPDSGRLVLSTRRTLPTAQAFVREFHTWQSSAAGGGCAGPLRTLHHVDGRLVVWRDGRYVDVPQRAIRGNLFRWLHEALEPYKDGAYRPFPAMPRTVESALETLCDYTHIDGDVPRWVSGRDDLPVSDILPLRDGFVYLPTRSLYPATPDLLTYAATDVAYSPAAAEPVEWLRFLRAIWPRDEESIQTLREWMGYSLTSDMTQQKILLLLGPRRSGKGTILRIMAELVGAANVCYPTVTLLASSFGMAAMLGKTLAIMSEPRFSAIEAPSAMERLLSISGCDPQTVDRKYNPVPIEVRLTSRIVVATNQVPSLPDASGAMAGRWLPIRMKRSWYGSEDIGLIDRLLPELPGILSWAIDGLVSLRERGRFAVPTSARDVVDLSHELSSPVMDWIEQRCELRDDATCLAKDLYASYEAWCKESGRSCPPINIWGRNLLAAAPSIDRTRKHTAQGDERGYSGIALRVIPPSCPGVTP